MYHRRIVRLLVLSRGARVLARAASVAALVVWAAACGGVTEDLGGKDPADGGADGSSQGQVETGAPDAPQGDSGAGSDGPLEASDGGPGDAREDADGDAPADGAGDDAP